MHAKRWQNSAWIWSNWSVLRKNQGSAMADLAAWRPATSIRSLPWVCQRLARLIDRDRVWHLIKVVFLPDYNVKHSQNIYPAADLS